MRIVVSRYEEFLPKSLAFLMAVVLLLSGCESKAQERGGHQGPPPVPVTLTPLKKEALSREVSLLGEVRSKSDASLKTLTSGVVSQLLVDVGSEIYAGQEVAYLDGVEQRIALAEAEARLAGGRSRLDELLNGTRLSVLHQHEAETRAAAARVAEAQATLEAVKTLGPQLVEQVAGDHAIAEAAEKSAADDFRRTQELVKNGALSSRELVRAQTSWDSAKGSLLRAEQARTVQKATNARDLANAQASLEVARAEEARSEASLSESREGARPEVIRAQREVVSALTAARDRATVEYSRTTVRAQSAGVVRERVAAVGDRLAAGASVFELSGRETELLFEVPENVQGQVKTGQTVLIAVEGSESPAEVKVLGVAQGLSQESRRQAIRVATPPQSRFLPGSVVQGTLLIEVEGDYQTTKRDALVDKKGRWAVFTVDGEGKAVEHTVTLLASVEERVAITGVDLKGSFQVVGRGAQALYPGAVVRLPEPAPTASPAAETKSP